MPAPAPRLVLQEDGEILVKAPAPAIEIWSWALYDFANTIFSMNIVTLYFAVWIVTEKGASNTAYSIATSFSSLLVLVGAPAIGVFSDASRRRKPWVVGLTVLSIAATAALSPLARLTLPPAAAIGLLLAVFVLANTAYQLAIPPYNAMLPELAPSASLGRLSGFGTALGYAGSIAGVLLVAPFVTGGLGMSGGGRQAAFLPTAVLFLLFSLPLFVFSRDHLARPPGKKPAVRLGSAFRELSRALADTKHHPGLLRFVLASWCYQDALGTAVSFMALYAVSVLGLPPGGEVRLFVILTVPAMAGAYVFGLAADRFGPKRALVVVLSGWLVGLVAVASAPTLRTFWAAGGLVGFVFGGIWATERPLLLKLVPDAEAGRYFGLLSLSARAAAIVGPLVWAFAVDFAFRPFGPHVAYRAAVASLALFMAAALWLLRGVPSGDPRRGGAPGGAGTV
jgi:MFS transporter, UMF1 family